MNWYEWVVVAAFMLVLTGAGLYCRQFIKGASDWLVAGRGCGRYLGATAGEAASLGAISIIAALQSAYVGGPVAWWIIIITIVPYLIIAVTGWGIYRLRETRIMTLNELLELRYTRKLRIFCGGLCFISGVLNMGIFPIVTGRFIVYFCHLPLEFTCLGLTCPTIPVVTGVLVLVALTLAFAGGQVSLILTDFLQWSVMMTMFITVGVVVYRVVNWTDIQAALLAQENPKQLVDPFLPTSANAFGLWYGVMFTFRAFYNVLSWAPNTVRSQSATEAREAKLMWILSYIRYGSNIGLLFAAVACFAFMRLDRFAEYAPQVDALVGQITNDKVRTEMVVPIFLSVVLPTGVKGLFVAGMISAALSTLDTYFLSWAGIFTQDVAAPLRRRPLSETQRLKLLRLSVVGVALFVYVFSILWKTNDYIYMYFAITGTIYTGGAGAIILGALYWRRGSTAGAWSAMITGSGLSLLGIILRQLYVNTDWWPQWLNGMSLSVIASCAAIFVFVAVSLLTRQEPFDLERLLHRDEQPPEPVTVRLRGRSLFDLVVGIVAFGLAAAILVAFFYSRTHDVSARTWIRFWKWYSFVLYGYSIPITLWFLIGSILDLRKLFRRLHASRDAEPV